MKKTLWRAAFVLLAASPAAAQTPAGIAGNYEIEYPMRMMVNGEPGPESTAKVKLVLEVQGDSVIGKWQLTSPNQMPAETLRGTKQGNTVRLWGSAQARFRGMGDEQAVTMQQEYAITIDGDKVSGTINVVPPEGMQVTIPARNFSGKRVTG